MTMEIVADTAVRAYPPRVTAFTAPFWSGLLDGRFMTTRCDACHRLTFPPKPICPHCWTDGIDWEAIGTDGRLYTWTRIHAGPAVFADQLPYEVGIVDLAVGLRVACRLWSRDRPDWQCGMLVRLLTLSMQDGPLFAATPA